jgi:hypothetical protein
MRRRLLTLCLGLIGLLFAYLLLLWSAWLPSLSEERARALALMEQPLQRTVGRDDAFPRLWLIRQDVPEDRLAAVFAADREAFLAWRQSGATGNFEPPSATEYPPLAIEPGTVCRMAPESCLDHVRMDPERARQVRDALEGLLRRGERLQEFDHARYGFHASFDSPIPPLGHLGGLQVMHAGLLYLDGDADAALDSACRNLGSWRRLRAHTDMLILDMIGIAYAGSHALLIAEMLAELPADHPLPPGCALALAEEAAEEFDQCDVWRGEFSLFAHTLEDLAQPARLAASGDLSPWQLRMLSIGLNQRATMAVAAQSYASLCNETEAWPEPRLDWQDRVFNPLASLVLVEIPDFGQYRERARDFAALMRHLRLLVWLRDQPDAAAALASRLPEFATPWHTLRYDPDTAEVSWPLLRPRPNGPTEWQLPLPESRVPAADAGDGQAPSPDAES